MSDHPEREPENEFGLLSHERYERVTVQGPMPDAASLQVYETFHPGATNEFLEIYRSEVEHRHEMDRRQEAIYRSVIESDLQRTRRAPTYGLIAVTMVVALAAYMVYSGSPHDAAIVATGVIVALAAVFVIGKASKPRDTESHETKDEAS